MRYLCYNAVISLRECALLLLVVFLSSDCFFSNWWTRQFWLTQFAIFFFSNFYIKTIFIKYHRLRMRWLFPFHYSMLQFYEKLYSHSLVKVESDRRRQRISITLCLAITQSTGYESHESVWRVTNLTFWARKLGKNLISIFGIFRRIFGWVSKFLNFRF